MPPSGASVMPLGLQPSTTDLLATRTATRTISTFDKPKLRPSSVEFSRSVFAIWWSAICVVHLVALGYHARITKFYWRLPTSPLGEMVELYELSLPYSYCQYVAVINATISGVHGIAVLRIARNSARAGQLVFYVDDERPAETAKSSAKRSKVRRLRDNLGGLFAYNGPLGVEGKYFDLLLYVAEFVETLLQTYQAYRVNSLVARRWLSRLYVGVLIFNCWSIPVIHVIYRARIAQKRLLSLMCDCILDLVSSVVVPGALFFVYLADYNQETRLIERTRWYDDRWLVQLWSEHDLIVITSWIDALSRLIFAIGLLFSLESVKQLLRVETVKPQTRPVLIRRLTRQFLQLVTSSEAQSGSWTATIHRRLTPLLRYNTETIVDQLRRIRWAAIFHAVLALWGFAIVAVHVDTEVKHASTPQLPVCPIQFSKWVHNAPVCLLLDVDCHALGIVGKADEIEARWHSLDPSSVLRLVFRHCPAFEMPLKLAVFHNLKSIKLYNSTIVSWNRSSSFTDALLPRFRSLQFVRVIFSDSKLPEGLLAVEFPQQVRIIELCVTNLGDLPSEIDQIWPQGLRLIIESSGLTSIPPAALRLAPWQLSVSGNPIHEAPAALFENPGIHRIGLANTSISSLPPNVSTASPVLRQLSIAHTQVTGHLPPWMDVVVARAQRAPFLIVALFAGGTPFCNDDPNSRRSVISCVDSLDEVSYPLAFEDEQSHLRAELL